MLADIIEYRNIDLCALFDSGDLIRLFDDLVRRHDMAFAAELFNFFIKLLMAHLIFFSTATPAWIISSNFK